ncbi:MAG: GIY-YIG nuclease family protein [Fidelibacterota bacterium]
MLQNPRGQFYKGYTEHLDNRLARHNEGRVPFTRNKGPWKLVHVETFESRSRAMKRESQLKKYSHTKILQLIESPTSPSEG